MPRHISHALDLLQAAPAEQLADRAGWGRNPNPEDDLDLLLNYLGSACGWHLAGLEVEPDDLWQVAQLWKRRPEVRGALERWVVNFPCRPFAGLVVRLFKERGHVYVAPEWLDYPGMEDHVRELVVRQARRWKDTWTSVHACLYWARYLDGGDEAWRQFAETFRQSEQRERLNPPQGGLGFLRHDLETHGTILYHESLEVNRHLERYDDVSPLQVIRAHHWWMSPRPVQQTASLATRVRCLHISMTMEAEFAQDRWSPEDTQSYASALASLGPGAVQAFQALEETPVSAEVCASAA